MDESLRQHAANLDSDNHDARNEAYHAFMAVTDAPVTWSYEIWDNLVTLFTHKNNHVRAVASQILNNLAAKSDPEGKIFDAFPALLQVTKDEKFVTARHCMQSLWKIGTAGAKQQALVVEGLTRRYEECVTEKNGTLIRYDILVGLRNLYDAVKDEAIREKALALIETETDAKYRKKYAAVWKK